MSEFIVYGVPYSTRVRTVRMACEQKGVAYDMKLTTPAEIKSTAHFELHPFGRMPIIRYGDTLLTETAVICDYIDSTFDGPSLKPADPLARFRDDERASWVNDYVSGVLLVKFVVQYVFPKGPDGKPDRAVIEGAFDEIRGTLKVLDDTYDGRDFLVGDTVTVADFFLAPIIAHFKNMPEGPDFLEDYPKVRQGMTAIEALDCYKATDPGPLPKR